MRGEGEVWRIFLVKIYLEITERQRRLIAPTATAYSLITIVIYIKSNFDSNIDVILLCILWIVLSNAQVNKVYTLFEVLFT